MGGGGGKSGRWEGEGEHGRLEGEGREIGGRMGIFWGAKQQRERWAIGGGKALSIELLALVILNSGAKQ